MDRYLILLSVVLSFRLHFLSGLHRHFNHHKCRPVNAYLFLDRSVDDDVVRVQKYYIYEIMNNTHDGSNIQLDTLNHTSIITLTEGVKNKENMLKWPKIIHFFPKGTTGVISATSLIDSISVYQSRNTNAPIQLFLVVNNETKVDDEEKLIEGLKSMKAFIVYYGEKSQSTKINKKSPSTFWFCLATDENHFINFNDDLNADILSFLRLSCQDSNLKCNNDMFWNRHMCKNCTYICSKEPSEDPQFCRDSCPYFRETKDELKCNGSSMVTSYKHFRETKDESKDNGSSVMTPSNNFRKTKDDGKLKGNGSSRMLSCSIMTYLLLWLVVWLYYSM
ncbi:uncharacterized protein LOC132730385 isoform X2 [Ruditapes philippinarum]|uniref:uncharacterized protein LOC132730385 isoform X2 n=1 Tax=Ruditapes philippinarum TaxID=129788 RepID=UPI00295B6ADC|nr:uncharacterized protein LOC132730385 isoform X2 [Ruditapes philippinarum]